ncbi:MAG: delta-60 repeat domain-containing protein [Flavobacteriales bacterium]|nr:delta-60 repeat domain-containing protein [Flavobacteriales bacterium]
MRASHRNGGQQQCMGCGRSKPDGKIRIGGSFTLFNGVSRNGIARLNTDRIMDTGFDPGSGVVGTVYSLNIQADGKIVLTGNFLTYNGIVRNNLAR